MSKNVCVACADKIIGFYDFHSMYLESDRKLRDMLAAKNEPTISSLMPFIKDEYETFNNYSGNMQMPIANEYYNDKGAAIPMDAAYNSGDGDAYKWKCSKCPARFKTRQLLRTHRKIHGKFVKDEKPRMPLPNSNNQHSAGRNINVPAVPGTAGGPIQSGHSSNHHVQQSPAPGLHQVQNKPVHMPINKDVDDKDTGEVMPLGPNFDASSVSKWKCNKCQKLFKTRAYLRKHRRNHGDQQPNQSMNQSAPVHQNPPQNNVYVSSGGGGGAVPGVSGNIGSTGGVIQGDKWICNQCTARFSTQNLLREHKKLHRKVKMPRPRPYPDAPHIPHVPHVTHASHAAHASHVSHVSHAPHTPHTPHAPHAPPHVTPIIPHVLPLVQGEPVKPKNHLWVRLFSSEEENEKQWLKHIKHNLL